MFEWMKYLSGGWIPQGKRTQVLGVVTFLAAAAVAVTKWGTGDMDFAGMYDALVATWPGLVSGLGLTFLGDKMDAKK